MFRCQDCCRCWSSPGWSPWVSSSCPSWPTVSPCWPSSIRTSTTFSHWLSRCWLNGKVKRWQFSNVIVVNLLVIMLLADIEKYFWMEEDGGGWIHFFTDFLIFSLFCNCDRSSSNIVSLGSSTHSPSSRLGHDRHWSKRHSLDHFLLHHRGLQLSPEVGCQATVRNERIAFIKN